MEYKALTGLSWGQLTRLNIMVLGEIGSLARPGAKKPLSAGLFHSVVMVVALMRRNLVQAAAGEIFGCSQPTVSRRWDLLRPVIGKVLGSFIPDPVQVLGRGGTALIDGTVCPTWDWNAVPDLFAGKAGYAGMNVQIAANLDGDVAAIGAVPVHGARHDAYAFEAKELKVTHRCLQWSSARRTARRTRLAWGARAASSRRTHRRLRTETLEAQLGDRGTDRLDRTVAESGVDEGTSLVWTQVLGFFSASMIPLNSASRRAAT